MLYGNSLERGKSGSRDSRQEAPEVIQARDMETYINVWAGESWGWQQRWKEAGKSE